MEFTAKQLTDLEGILWRAAEDMEFQQELRADPAAVFRRDADVELPSDSVLRVLFSSDSDVSIVLPILDKDRKDPQPVVVYPEHDAEESGVFEKLSDLANHVGSIVTKCLQDTAFRSRLIAEPNAAFRDFCGVDPKLRFQVIDPAAADYTIILPGRSSDEQGQPVIFLPPSDSQDAAPEFPGVSVFAFGQPATGELSDDALDAVVGGAGSGKGTPLPHKGLESPINIIDFN